MLYTLIMSEEVTRRFLARLWELQAEHGLKDAQLAAILGCTPSYLSHLRAWKRPRRLGLDFALAAARTFTDLRDVLLSELPVSNTALPPVDETASGTPPDSEV
jgi:transcriptional regulator with XRE-family HTH domain